MSLRLVCLSYTHGRRVGCEALPRIAPKLHVFGHIHEAYGVHVGPRTV